MRSDREAIAAVMESIKAFFTGTMATRGRRSDLNRNVFYAAAAAVIPKGVRENKQTRAVMRLTGLRHDAIMKALAMRTDMDDQCCGWKLLTTARHHDAVDYSPLDRWFHSPLASTEDNEVKKQIRVGEVIDEETKVYSYQLHNRRYLNAKLPILHKDFSESPELKEMQLKFEQVERQKRRKKALAKLKLQLKKDNEEREPRGEEVSAAEMELGDEYQRKRAVSLAKAAKREQTGDEAAVSEAEVDAQMGNAPRLPELTVSLDKFRKRKCKCFWCTERVATVTASSACTSSRTCASSASTSSAGTLCPATAVRSSAATARRRSCARSPTSTCCSSTSSATASRCPSSHAAAPPSLSGASRVPASWARASRST